MWCDWCEQTIEDRMRKAPNMTKLEKPPKYIDIKDKISEEIKEIVRIKVNDEYLTSNVKYYNLLQQNNGFFYIKIAKLQIFQSLITSYYHCANSLLAVEKNNNNNSNIQSKVSIHEFLKQNNQNVSV